MAPFHKSNLVAENRELKAILRRFILQKKALTEGMVQTQNTDTQADFFETLEKVREFVDKRGML